MRTVWDHKRSVILLIASCIVAVVLPFHQWVSQDLSRHLRDAITSPPRGKDRLFIRVAGTTPEGIGSFVTHLAHDAILARTLGFRFIVMRNVRDVNGHGYHSSDLINRHLGVANVGNRICDIEDLVTQHELRRTADDICAGDIGRANALAESASNCDIIVHVVLNDFFMRARDLSFCMADWLAETLCPQNGKDLIPGIAIYVRWGDCAVPPGQPFNERTVVPDSLNSLWRKDRGVVPTIFIEKDAEGDTDTYLSNLNFTFGVHRQGGLLEDLCTMARYQTLVTFPTSLTAVAAAIHGRDKLIVTQDDGVSRFRGLTIVDFNDW